MQLEPSQTVVLLASRLRDAKLRWQTVVDSIGVGVDKANAADAETPCTVQPHSSKSPDLSGCRECPAVESRFQLSHDNLSAADNEIQRGRCLLLATISALRTAAEAALDRAETSEVTALECLAAAEAAEQSQAATLKQLQVAKNEQAAILKQLQAAKNNQSMEQSIELRIRDSVTAGVKATIRAVSQEATAELRAATEEIRRLRADCCSSSCSSSRDVHASVCEKIHVDFRGWRQEDGAIRPECHGCHVLTATDEAKLAHSGPAELRSYDNSGTSDIGAQQLWISGLDSSNARSNDAFFPSSLEGSLVRTNSKSNVADKTAPLPGPANSGVEHEFAPVRQQQQQKQQQLVRLARMARRRR